MASQEQAVKCLKHAIENEKNKNYASAIESYHNALAHFATVAVTSETLATEPILKEEIQHHVKYCVDHVEKIKLSEGGRETQTVSPIDSHASMCAKKKLTFGDLCGMETIKNDLTQALITPMKRPKVFSRGITPYKGFLLFGPPGTGKSSIAKAVAEEAGLNFFYISAGDILSKYIGESEESIRDIFAMARNKAPSIIFIDEIDAVASKRSDLDNSRGTKTELFIQMDSVLGITDGVFFMASTNCPQHLDSALLRRFDKLIYVPLPEKDVRMEIFRKKLSDIRSDELSEDKFEALAAKTAGFSPSDIEKICTNAKNLSLKRLLQENPVKKCGNDVEAEEELSNACKCCTPILLYEDVLQALREANPTVDRKEVAALETFAEQRGDGKTFHETTPPVQRSLLELIFDFFTDCP